MLLLLLQHFARDQNFSAVQSWWRAAGPMVLRRSIVCRSLSLPSQSSLLAPEHSVLWRVLWIALHLTPNLMMCRVNEGLVGQWSCVEARHAGLCLSLCRVVGGRGQQYFMEAGLNFPQEVLAAPSNAALKWSLVCAGTGWYFTRHQKPHDVQGWWRPGPMGLRGSRSCRTATWMMAMWPACSLALLTCYARQPTALASSPSSAKQLGGPCATWTGPPSPTSSCDSLSSRAVSRASYG